MPALAKFKAHGIKVDVSRFSQALEDQMRELMKEGAVAFVQATASKVPVWSGMAAGSLLNLAELVGTHIKVSPVDDAPNRVSLGRTLSLGASIGRYIRNIGDYKFSFRFGTNVPHFAFLDNPNNNFSEVLKYFKLKTPPPWEAIDYGLSAMASFIERNKKDYAPRISRLMKTYKVEYS